MRNVLVIEDQPEIANLIRLHLQDLPCKVAGQVPAGSKDAGNLDLNEEVLEPRELVDSAIADPSGHTGCARQNMPC